MQTQKIDYKFWLEELIYFVGQILYTLGEFLAALCYFVLVIFNILSGNLHNESVDDERRRLYEEEKRQRLWEEQEQREFEERQRLYSLKFGNWQERHLSAVTAQEREEADTARDIRGVRLEILDHDGRTAIATADRIEQMKFDSHRRRNRIEQLRSDADHFRHLEYSMRGDENRDSSRQIRDVEAEIAALERVERQAQLDLQMVSL